ncbi:NAD(P)/FAD-dependent oxidoreductase [Natronorubrum texcoconense]|uniref:Thioredoxin reductase n=1 Tax=Natronorubrum texcoconense TaxID=1095776 RepID=A0A1G8YI87_9EURY|nr:NAD(P)/FAD-dependent oxidoreductase [Natronorubrum texcoconense]SDK01895.1 Thioredoxin reductase [Natronorubrum texcoconense]
MTLSRPIDVAIVGAGPAGIGTAVALERLDLEYAVLERDRIGASFRQWPDEMRLLTPSFPANAFGVRDLNAITLDTSPALALAREHPTGDQYADYLEAVAEFHELPIETGVDVEAVVPDGDESADERSGDEGDANRGGFTLETSGGTIAAQYVVWAAGQYQYPSSGSIPGASDAVHVSTIDSWSAYADQHSTDSATENPAPDCETEPEEPESSTPVAADGAGVAIPAADDAVIVGGAESGIDAALGLADAGLSVTVLDDDGPWQYRSPDPSEVLSPRTTERLETALEAGRPIDLVTEARVERIDRESASEADIDLDSDGFAVVTEDGDRIHSSTPPILTTGFEGSLTLVDDLFAFDDRGFPALTDRDESTETPGLFLVGPQVAHNGQQFCFIYKFRQRFAVVAETVGERLGVDTAPLEAYREKQMLLDDLECCEPEYCDC